ncbi:MAG: hypothetical protein EOP46_12935 [Sphingobacteriaceae bacterium]|nr:MAG: hypothetical protein EOP46_12935 [Sphingobacteriaceae bacterium]
MNINKKYVLKPGKHQFAPAEAAVHDNDSLTDEAAAWYLEKYPHIHSLFVSLPTELPAGKKQKTVKPKLVLAEKKEDAQ